MLKLCQSSGVETSFFARGKPAKVGCLGKHEPQQHGTMELFLLALQKIGSFACIWMCGASATSSLHQVGSLPISENNLGIFQDSCPVQPLLGQAVTEELESTSLMQIKHLGKPLAVVGSDSI